MRVFYLESEVVCDGRGSMNKRDYLRQGAKRCVKRMMEKVLTLVLRLLAWSGTMKLLLTG